MLKSSAKELLDLKSPISLMRELRDNNYNQFDPNLWKEMVEMGWTALTIPEEYNGLNFGYVGLGQVIEEMGKKLTVSPMISTVLVSTTIVGLSKNEVLKSKLFDEIMSGKKLCTLAHEESTHHNPKIDLSIISNDNEKFILNGKKNFVIDGGFSDYIIVAAKTSDNEDQISLFILNKNSNGLSILPTVMVDHKNAANIEFKDVSVSQINLLGNENSAKEVIEETLAPLNRQNGENPAKVVEDLREMMQHKVGIIRTEKLLKEALKDLEKLEIREKNTSVGDSKIYNPGWHQALEIGAMIDVSKMCALAALHREESRGGHTRDDFPVPDHKYWGKMNSVITKKDVMSIEHRRYPSIDNELKQLLDVEDLHEEE